MYPLNFNSLLNVPAVQAVFGTPIRIYASGHAPKDVATPYAVHQLISSVPDNLLDHAPLLDAERVQVTVWHTTAEALSAAVVALRTVLQEFGEIESIVDLGRDPDTSLYGFAIDVARLESWAAPPLP